MIALVAVVLALILFVLLAACLGGQVLRVIGLRIEERLENLLSRIAVGSVLLQILCFLPQPFQNIRLALLVVLFLSIAASLQAMGETVRLLTLSWAKLTVASRTQKYLLALIASALLLDLLAALAPLSSSDALHYHFAAPLLVLREGFQPNFFLSHSFFTGQGHAFILAGLAFSSEKLATGLLFLGGFLATGATYLLARQCVSVTFALLATVLFVLTPLVTWQISSGGAPDLWMCFFAATAVVLLSRISRQRTWQLSFVVGILAGGIAGTKYTGCCVAFALLVAVLIESRSIRQAAIFAGSSLLFGASPYVRNFIWAGDPVFPFLLPKLNAAALNQTAMNFYRLDTGAAAHHTLWQLTRYLSFSWVDPARVGFWQFFGPLVLAFLPFALVELRNTPLWRIVFSVWIVSGVILGLTSSMPRFLLVIYPIVIAIMAIGVQSAFHRHGRLVKSIALASVFCFLLGSTAGVVIYEVPAWAASVGIVSKTQYLNERAPDYQLAEYINRSLEGKTGSKKVLIFFRHVYFLRVPYIYGNPRSSWGVDPSHLRSPQEWREFFRHNSIGWVVRSPDYPESLADSLGSMEKQCMLAPLSEGEVESFQGKRSAGIRQRLKVAILQVNDQDIQSEGSALCTSSR